MGRRLEGQAGQKPSNHPLIHPPTHLTTSDLDTDLSNIYPPTVEFCGRSPDALLGSNPAAAEVQRNQVWRGFPIYIGNPGCLEELWRSSGEALETSRKGVEKLWSSPGGALEERWRSAGELWRRSGGALEEVWRSSGAILELWRKARF